MNSDTIKSFAFHDLEWYEYSEIITKNLKFSSQIAALMLFQRYACDSRSISWKELLCRSHKRRELINHLRTDNLSRASTLVSDLRERWSDFDLKESKLAWDRTVSSAIFSNNRTWKNHRDIDCKFSHRSNYWWTHSSRHTVRYRDRMLPR
jgi:hypothetical protein